MKFMLNRKLPDITVKIPLKRQFIDRVQHFTFRYFLPQKQRNLRTTTKKISSEGHVLFAFDELKCKKQIKHLVRETNTELLESDDLVDVVVSMETVGNATAELTTSTREYEQEHNTGINQKTVTCQLVNKKKHFTD